MADTGSSIIFATGGYDHSIKFWHPHDGVCYRTAQHPESVRSRVCSKKCTPPNNKIIIFLPASKCTAGDSRQEIRSISRLANM